MRNKLFKMSACAAILSITGLAGADTNRYEEVVQAQILAVSEVVFESFNSADPVEYFDGTVASDGNVSFDLPVYPDRTYALIGACDQDCGDIDLYVRDGSGYEIDKDTETDDSPVVTFTSQRGETYSARLRMYNCDTSICYYGVVMFEIDS